MKKSCLSAFIGFALILTSCVSVFNIDESGDVITSGSVYIAEIAPYEAFPIARIFAGDGIGYSLEVTAESGVRIFSALRIRYEESITRGQGGILVMTGETLPWSPIYCADLLGAVRVPGHTLDGDGFYYLFVGSNGDYLIGVNINIVGTGSSAKIELLR